MATTHIVWSWGSNTNIDFHADTDILDFGWFQADQFTVSEVNGTVVIAIHAACVECRRQSGAVTQHPSGGRSPPKGPICHTTPPLLVT